MKKILTLVPIILLLCTMFFISCAQSDSSTSGDGGGTTGTSSTDPVKLINYPMETTNDEIDITRGFYITSYPGTTLTKVTLWISTNYYAGGTYNITLTARDSAYNGTEIGHVTNSTFLIGNLYQNPIDFVFNNCSVTKSNTITFTLSVSGGSGSCYYNSKGAFGGLTGSGIGIVITNGITPPLDSFNKYGASIIVYGKQ